MTGSCEPVWLIRGGLIALAIAALGNGLGLWDFSHWLTGLPHLCLVHVLTGHDCPGCGMGRALALLTHGQVRASLHQHPFALPLLIWMSCRAMLPDRILQRRQARWPTHREALPSALVALLIAWWLATKVL